MQVVKRRGRPTRFHDRLCRDRCHLVRGRLMAEMEDLNMAQASTPQPATDERIYQENLTRRRSLPERDPKLKAPDRPSDV